MTVAANIDCDSGTSFANPRVAGHGVLSKDYFIETGQDWFNAPGWLHTYMLGQGDTHRAPDTTACLPVPGTPPSTANAVTGAHNLYGLGRVKMRHPSQFSYYLHDFRSLSFTTLNPYNFVLPSVGMNSSVKIVKCVAAQHEDMSGKDNIGRMKLEMWIRNPVSGHCSQSGAQQDYLIDSSYDTKKMGAFRVSDGVPLSGKCLHVRVTPLVLPTSGSIWTQTFCYAANLEDDEPN